MADPDDEFIFLSEEEASGEDMQPQEDPWKILIIDDDLNILQTSMRILRDFTFEGRGLNLLMGTSGPQAKELMDKNPDAAIVLLDVIMETDEAGLDVVTYIRDELKNDHIRILLRTGQAGQFDENAVFDQYDINDFLEKSELTSRRLKTALKVALRAYRMQENIHESIKREKILRKQADAANKAKSDFLANMSHELRSPMTSIKFGLSTIQEILLDPEASDEDRDDGLKAINFASNSADRLMGMVGNILDSSRLDSSQMAFTMKACDIQDSIAVAVQEISPILEAKSISLNTMLEDTDSEIEMDCDRIIQVLINLLNNAAKFSPNNSEITLALSKGFIEEPSDTDDIPAIIIKIQDQGVGIPDRELESIFDKFTQSSKTQDGSGGTGLGLSISREILEAHNGTIVAENNPDGGSIFTLKLPCE